MENSQKILITDNDSSISYNKSEISSICNYKVSIDELHNIFINDLIKIFWCNTSECLTFILDDGREISLHDYSDNNDMHPILIHLLDIDAYLAVGYNHFMLNDLNWDNRFRDLLENNCQWNESNVEQDFDGYNHCQEIIKNANNSANNNTVYTKMYVEDIQAIKYCNEQTLTINEQLYQGYLPAMGELYFIRKYIDMLNYIFVYLGVSQLFLNTHKWWSSTEMSSHLVWHLNDGKTDFNKYKWGSSSIMTFPLFKKVVNQSNE